MRHFSTIWAILVYLALAAIVLAMFHIARSPFETIVISVLILIYESVMTSHVTLRNTQSKKWDIDLARHIAIARSLKLNIDLEEEAQKENIEADELRQMDFWITAFFNMLFRLVAIGNLIYAITFQSN